MVSQAGCPGVQKNKEGPQHAGLERPSIPLFCGPVCACARILRPHGGREAMCLPRTVREERCHLNPQLQALSFPNVTVRRKKAAFSRSSFPFLVRLMAVLDLWKAAFEGKLWRQADPPGSTPREDKPSARKTLGIP